MEYFGKHLFKNPGTLNQEGKTAYVNKDGPDLCPPALQNGQFLCLCPSFSLSCVTKLVGISTCYLHAKSLL